ncbi:MAG: phosphotransferase [Acidobacteria bacterium]|nr:phosphotransferase [Acidobacteriota bacterium]
MPEVITDTSQVTPDWLTGRLRARGFLPAGRVSEIKISLSLMLPLSVANLLEVYYSSKAAPSLPSKFFLKFSRPDLSAELAAQANGKEVEFYQLIAAQMPDTHLIRCYDAARAPDSGRIHLLLEDLTTTHAQTEWPQFPSQEECEQAVSALAKLHAFWWEHPRLGKDVGQLLSDDELKDFIGEVENNVTRFLDFLGDELSPPRREIYERLLAAKHLPWRHLTGARRLTLIHGDAHCWNFLYPREPQRERVRLFDWSLWHVDLGARDLAFMMALGWERERRALMELKLLRKYYDGLVACGVKNYSWDECFDDYRWSSIRNLNVPVIQWSQGRNAALWQGNLERALLAYEDLACAELLCV